jgi:hypothetical protein
LQKRAVLAIGPFPYRHSGTSYTHSGRMSTQLATAMTAKRLRHSAGGPIIF